MAALEAYLKLQINYIRLPQYCTQKKFPHANLLHFSYIFMAKLHQNGQNLLARLHGNQILIPKFWHLFSSFCIKGQIWCKFQQNLRHAVSSPYSKYFGAYSRCAEGLLARAGLLGLLKPSEGLFFCFQRLSTSGIYAKARRICRYKTLLDR